MKLSTAASSRTAPHKHLRGDAGNNTIRRLTANHQVTTIAGLPAGPTAAPIGTNTTARFLVAPQAVAVDPAGNVYVADTGNNTIRKITPAGVVTTLAGSSTVRRLRRWHQWHRPILAAHRHCPRQRNESFTWPIMATRSSAKSLLLVLSPPSPDRPPTPVTPTAPTLTRSLPIHLRHRRRCRGQSLRGRFPATVSCAKSPPPVS